MDTPFFSVIIPVLNEEKFLPQLLSCLVKQTFRDFEVIVVDGGSTDKTVEHAKKFTPSLPNLQVHISHKANAGFQRNVGASQGRGKYLVFFDADVGFSRKYLEQIAHAIKKNNFIFVTTWVRVDSKDSKEKLAAVLNNMVLESAKIIKNPFCGGWNTIILRSAFEQVGGFNEKILIGEDHDFTRRCLKAGIILTILKHPRIIFSFRRLRKYGYWTMIQKYAHISVYGLLKKPITKAIFDYPMGGAMYKGIEKVPQGGFARFERSILRSLQKILQNKE